MALSFSPSMCSGNAIPYPTVPGAEILSLQSTLVSNYSQFVHEGYYLNHHSVDVTNVSFCNVTVAYTHPGENDTVHVKVYLPLDGWNERMQAIGGSGWTAGFSSVSAPAMIGAVGQGYVAVTTDGGHYSDLTGDPSSWVLRSNGELNWHALQDFASVTLNDAAIIGKSLAESVYGRAPKYSYWSGCSQGGRQGLMLAQRYPTAFNGIVASAPAINIDRFMVTDYWPQLIMTLQDEYPYPCELNALTAAAIAACDSNDGVIDGLLSDPDSCHFDPHALVGTTFNCSDTGAEQKISKIAADVASAAWMGARSTNGSFLWYGINRDAILSGNGLDTIGPANTECDKNGTCVAAPPSLLTDWIRVFVEKNPDFPLSNMTHEEFDQIFEKSVREFDAIAGTNDPDLSAFRDAGGKMLTFHGLVCYYLLRTHDLETNRVNRQIRSSRQTAPDSITMPSRLKTRTCTAITGSSNLPDWPIVTARRGATRPISLTSWSPGSSRASLRKP